MFEFPVSALSWQGVDNNQLLCCCNYVAISVVVKCMCAESIHILLLLYMYYIIFIQSCYCYISISIYIVVLLIYIYYISTMWNYELPIKSSAWVIKSIIIAVGSWHMLLELTLRNSKRSKDLVQPHQSTCVLNHAYFRPHQKRSKSKFSWVLPPILYSQVLLQ